MSGAPTSRADNGEENSRKVTFRPSGISAQFVLLVGLAIVTTALISLQVNRGVHTRALATDNHHLFSLRQEATTLKASEERVLSVPSEADETNNVQLKAERAAIVGLTTNTTEDINDFCNALKSLSNLPDASQSANSTTSRTPTPADVIIFHEGNLSDEQQQALLSCAQDRSVIFPSLEYSFETFFPDGFDPIKEQSNWKKRSKWGYQQMIRFWITFIWKHPAVQPYTTLMRLDSDACWNARSKKTIPVHLPALPASDNNSNKMLVYHASKRKLESQKWSQGFGTFVHDYVQKNNLTPKNPELFADIPTDPNEPSPMYFNNFEVARLDFMQRPEVVAFHHAMTESEPFAVFRYRWGDAIARFAVMALFAAPDEMITSGSGMPDRYLHGDACAKRFQ